VNRRADAYRSAAGDGQRGAAPERPAVNLWEECRQLFRQPSAAVQPPLNSPIKWSGIAAEAGL
jgi:hypothetical protein